LRRHAPQKMRPNSPSEKFLIPHCSSFPFPIFPISGIICHHEQQISF
jgi:hypothetical protein